MDMIEILKAMGALAGIIMIMVGTGWVKQWIHFTLSGNCCKLPD